MGDRHIVRCQAEYTNTGPNSALAVIPPDCEEIQDLREEVDESKHQNKKMAGDAPPRFYTKFISCRIHSKPTGLTWPKKRRAAKLGLHQTHILANRAKTKKKRIARLAYDALRDCGYYELTRLTCEYQCHRGVLVLRGRVSTFHMKQVAQTVVKVIEQVREIKNEVAVDYRT